MPEPSSPAAGDEVCATVRIDAAPSGKKFQGVWLELDHGQRYVIDYRPRELWRGFADAAVVVTGHCFAPVGQAINHPHFRVERMRFADRPQRATQILAIGPVTRMSGELVDPVWPAGTRRAGAREWLFHGGQVYAVCGDVPRAPGAVTILARVLEIDPSYAATAARPTLWIERVVDADATEREPPKTAGP